MYHLTRHASRATLPSRGGLNIFANFIIFLGIDDFNRNRYNDIHAVHIPLRKTSKKGRVFRD